jgi:hypothetical protein
MRNFDETRRNVSVKAEQLNAARIIHMLFQENKNSRELLENAIAAEEARGIKSPYNSKEPETIAVEPEQEQHEPEVSPVIDEAEPTGELITLDQTEIATRLDAISPSISSKIRSSVMLIAQSVYFSTLLEVNRVAHDRVDIFFELPSGEPATLIVASAFQKAQYLLRFNEKLGLSRIETVAALKERKILVINADDQHNDSLSIFDFYLRKMLLR